MKKARSSLRAAAFTAALALALPGFPAAHADEMDGREIIERVENLLWAKTMQGEFEMSIVTPRWRRTLELRVFIERPTRSFIRILAPAKEAGIGSLRIGAEMWNYLPNVERTIKIPPSMMLQPWMGSDFTNDDLVKASNAVNDYTQKILRIENVDDVPAYVVEAVPKPDAAVVWGRLLYWVRQADFVPIKEEFYSERGELVRVMTFSDVRPIGGRVVPTRWEIRPQAKPGNATVVVLKNAAYDRPIDAEVFTQRNLQKP
ncbi:MAG TPA: outer membrane lipoprotein-sorting protein [Burkholderiaceae bacterium]|nr:outer membrane lipoprotein-sorting protein [Burkholderiaceae bacterium]